LVHAVLGEAAADEQKIAFIEGAIQIAANG
jgi:hypothetical protein